MIKTSSRNLTTNISKESGAQHKKILWKEKSLEVEKVPQRALENIFKTAFSSLCTQKITISATLARKLLLNFYTLDLIRIFKPGGRRWSWGCSGSSSELLHGKSLVLYSSVKNEQHDGQSWQVRIHDCSLDIQSENRTGVYILSFLPPQGNVFKIVYTFPKRNRIQCLLFGYEN